MNLSLHHFKKEALNIRGRWALWLMLLGIDLAIQLEWLMPMTHREFNHFAPDSAHFLVMIAAVVVAVSGCPEDQPSRSNAFIATRPLSRASYYAARVLLIVLMLVAPLVLQEALYLKLSHRPWRDVAQGVAWRAIVAGAWLAWVLPGMAVWKGWVQTLLGAGVFLGVLWLSEKLASNWFTTGGVARESITYSLQAQVLAAWLGAAVMLVLAWLHNRGRWPLARRLAATAALSPLFYLAMQAVDARSKDWRAEAPARVAELAKSIQVTVPQERLRPNFEGHLPDTPCHGFHGPSRDDEASPRGRDDSPRDTGAGDAGRQIPAITPDPG